MGDDHAPRHPDERRRAGSKRPGHVSAPGTSQPVDIRDQRQIIDLLDEHVPTVPSRKDRLLQVLTLRAS